MTVVFCLVLGSKPSYGREFKIIATPQTLFRTQTDTGFQGVDIDVVSAVLNKMEIAFSVELLYSSKRLLHKAKQGKADMILSLSKTPSRLTFLDYPKVSYKDVSWHFFALKENQRQFSFNRYQDLKGVTIGAVQEYSYSKAFWQADLSLITVADNEALLGLLLKKRVELIPMNRTYLLFRAKQLGRADDIVMLAKPITVKAYFNPFPKNSNFPYREQLIARYDKVLAELIRAGEIAKIYAR